MLNNFSEMFISVWNKGILGVDIFQILIGLGIFFIHEYELSSEKAKDKDDPVRLMGFGHRVYKNYDPRATLIKASCDKLLAKIDRCDPLFDIAQQLEEVARGDDYFIERKLYPNVDFYSGIILKALGIPTSMFTVIFAIGRTVGWIAHWNEMIGGAYRIGRPRQLYTGEKKRDFVPLDKR